MIDPMTEDDQALLERQHEEATAQIQADDFKTLVEDYRTRVTPRGLKNRAELEQRELRLLAMLHRNHEALYSDVFLGQCLADYGLSFVLKAFAVALETA